MLRLYNTALLPLRLGAALYAAWAGRDPDRRREWDERRSRRPPRIAPGGVWIHGASVGESRIAIGLARRLRAQRPDLPLALSAYTPAGRALLPEPPEVSATFFIPLDFAGWPARLLDAVKPAALVLIETELWPNLLHEASRVGVRVLVLNGRLSPSRMRRYRRLAPLYRPLLERLRAVGAQSEADARRFAGLGADPLRLVVTGNVKYDLPPPERDATTLRRRLGLAVGRPVFVAGSTAPEEDLPALEAHERARRERPELLLMLAPRHLDRVAAVEQLVRSRGTSCVRFSSGEPVPPAGGVLLVDTVGDLAGLYQLADVVFVGGSLVPVGGHNVLEPAAVGVPVLFGPHTQHFDDPAHELERAGAGLRVVDAANLAETLCHLLRDSERRRQMGRAGERVVAANRGALDRSVALLLETLDATDAGGSGVA